MNQKQPLKGKNVNAASLEQNLAEVRRITADIVKQKTFVNSLPFQIGQLKQILEINITSAMYINIIIEMIENNILEIFMEIIENQAQSQTPRENIILKSGDIIFDMLKKIIKENNKEYKNLFINKHNAVKNIKKIISFLPVNLADSLKLFLGMYRHCAEFLYLMKIDNTVEPSELRENRYNEPLQDCYIFLLTTISRCESDPLITQILFDMIKMFANLKQFKDILLNATSSKDFNIKGFTDTLMKIVSTCDHSPIVLLGMQIFDPLLKTNEMKVVIKEMNPISFLLLLLNKFKQNYAISFYSCRVLSQILEKDDVETLLDIISFNTYEDFKSSPKYENAKSIDILNELNEIHLKDNNMFNEMKKNISRILLILSKEKAFRNLINDISSPEWFIVLLHSDIQIYDENKPEEKELILSILPDSIILLLGLLKNVVFEVYENNKLLQKIAYCFVRSMQILRDDIQIVSDLIDFFLQFNHLFYTFFLNWIKEEEAEQIFIYLLSKHYNIKSVFSFLHKCPINSIYRNNLPDQEPKMFNVNCKKLITLVDELTLMFNEKKKEEMLYHIHSISLKLILGVTINAKENDGAENLFDNTSFKLYINCMNKLIVYIINLNPKSGEVYTDDNVCYLMTLTFSSIENIIFSQIAYQNEPDSEDKILNSKSDIFSALLDRLSSTKTLNLPILSYLSQRLSKLIEYKVLKVTKVIFTKESLCEFSLSSLAMFQKTQEQVFLQEILAILNQIFSQSKEGALISKFLAMNGISALMKVIEYGITKNGINDYLVANLELMTKQMKNDISVMYENPLLFKSMVISLKDIKFSKGLNAKVYSNLILFFISILYSKDFIDTADEQNLISHLTKEYSDIFSFYFEDTNNTLLATECDAIINLTELISLCCKGSISLSKEIQLNFFNVNMSILTKMKHDLNNNFQGKLFENIVLMIISLLKSKEKGKETYSIPLLKKQIEIINEIIPAKVEGIDEMLTMFSFFETVINFENNAEITSNRLITIEYIESIDPILDKNELMSDNPRIKNEFSKCLELLKNPNLSHSLQSINEDNEKMLKELSLLTTERKNAVRRTSKLNDQNEVAFCPRKRTLNSVNSQRIKLYFDKIIPNFNHLIKEIPKKALNHQDVKSENNNLGDLLLMLKYFTKDEENLKKLIDNEIVNKLILIIETDNLFSLSCQENSYKLIDIIAQNEMAFESFIQNKALYQFILREINKISKYYKECEMSSFLSLKITTILYILSQLSMDQTFISENQAKLSINNMTKIIQLISNEDKDVATYILKIIQNILSQTGIQKEQNELEDEKRYLSEMLIKDVWKRFSYDVLVLESIINIIKVMSQDQEFIEMLIDMELIENLCQILIIGKEKKNSSGFSSVLSLMNTLSQYDQFIEKIIEIGILPIYNSVNDNIFNKQILENCLLLLIAIAKKDKKQVNNLWISGINDFCLLILHKYNGTCHHLIIQLTLELIIGLIEDENSIKYFSVKGFDIIIKTFTTNVKNNNIVLLSFQIINMITSLDINFEIDRKIRRNSILYGYPAGKNNKNSIYSSKNDNRGEGDNKNENHKQDYRKNNISSYDQIATSTIKFQTGDSNTKENGASYNFQSLIDVIVEVLVHYSNDYEIFKYLCQLLQNIYIIAPGNFFQSNCLTIIIKNVESYLSDTQIDFIQLCFVTIHQMLKINDSVLQQNNTSLIFSIHKVILKIKVNSIISKKFIHLISIIVNQSKKFQENVLKEIMKIMTWFSTTNDFEKTEKMVLQFSNIASRLSSHNSQFSIDFMTYIIKLVPTYSPSEKVLENFLENVLVLSEYYKVTTESNAKELAEILFNLFKYINLNKYWKIMINLLKIISMVCIQSELMKNEFLKENTDLGFELKEFYNRNKEIDDMLVIYEAKSCEINIKKKILNDKDVEMIKANLMANTNRFRASKLEVSMEIREYLTKEYNASYYNEKGEIIKSLIQMDNDLTKITAFKKGKNQNEKIAEMDVLKMDTCVRNCSTPAFIKSKKPKAKNCFSIFGIKELNNNTISFNIECKDEDHCIKYVDYISTLINNHKTGNN